MQINGMSFILYVADQSRSRAFYQKVLQADPVLDEEGMTAFKLHENSTLGIMPEKSIAKILGTKVPHPMIANGIPRSEVYLYVEDPLPFYNRALDAGGVSISEYSLRAWGHWVAYVIDMDGHVLAFTKK